MNCKNCSHSIKEGETFCLNCGTKIEAEPTINTSKIKILEMHTDEDTDVTEEIRTSIESVRKD